MELISVIVPVYKVEEYLNRCVQSIVGQTYTNLEIILVDDGSPDGCPQMCDEWAQKDGRIHAIHKQNGGLSDARNAGMEYASGEYIAFIDSDDWIDKRMLQRLYENIKTCHSDIASCGAYRFFEESNEKQPMLHFSGNHVLNRTEAMKALIQSTYLIQTVWNKLYRRAIIKDIPFEIGKIHEDEYWSWRAISNASVVSVMEESFYYYVQRPGSIMNSDNLSAHFNVVNAKIQRNKYIQENMTDLRDIASIELLYTCYYQCCKIVANNQIHKYVRCLKELQSTVNSCEISKVYLRSISLKKRISLAIMKKSLITKCIVDCKIRFSC